ncbi:hypothetical protein CCAX7_45660 [Capsulimonas corticalis]|uniref:Uncharacterized protein n=1 Tax=Capsulimonas corticalis TaxID=2219043 RepID=A0A402D5V9_9BACT|nr:hypothetical protein [Capsulimonas corticalis]BDI32515.1 hypothetical protein CCAX7_45660 [Capsulimonas corticalis]
MSTLQISSLSTLALLSGMLALSASKTPAATLTPSAAGLSVSVDEASGAYTVTAQNPAWTFSGTVGAPLTDVRSTSGRDKLGGYRQIAFGWKTDASREGTIRVYDARPLVQFSIATPQASHLTQDFPAFTTFPQNIHTLSYVENAMSPPSVNHLRNNGTPWFLFDDEAHAAVLSAGSDFFVAQMHGDGKTLLASGLNPSLADTPAGFTHTSWLAIGPGIEVTVHAWGDAITTVSGKTRPADDADLTLKSLGYWTDNGAYYYYNYDKDKGYAGTIQAVADEYRAKNIPIRYMQIDSWWYQKTQVPAGGGAPGGLKVASLPAENWNAYGGTLDYSASPALFPDGLAAFQKQLGLPLVVHGRWIDRTSPYHANYKISGVAAVDPRWWDDRTDYLKSSGVVTYEQDWLNEIYKNSPEMASTLETGPAFADNMARAAKAHGQTLQYCMPLPRFFLQGTHYNNLTTIRTSNDRFSRSRWNDFLYTSILADAMNIRPWTDVFMSTEMDNLTIAVLSSGPVGTGDAIGAESRPNLLRAVREDGAIVRPDAPLLPVDATLVADASSLHHPFLASTFTDNGQRTVYAFAYTRSGDAPGVSFTPSSLGLSGPVYVYKSADGSGRRLSASETYSDTLGAPDWAEYVIAPVGRSGVAFLGDAGKIVGTGRSRISSLQDAPGKLTVSLVLSPTEDAVTLHGYAASAPTVSVKGGSAQPAAYNAATGYFTVQVSVSSKAPTTLLDGDPVRRFNVVLKTKA